MRTKFDVTLEVSTGAKSKQENVEQITIQLPGKEIFMYMDENDNIHINTGFNKLAIIPNTSNHIVLEIGGK